MGRKYVKRAVLGLVVLLAPGGIAASGPLTIQYYDVHGDTLQDAGQWMNQHGPVGKDGRRFHGYTEWAVRWRYQLQPGRSACTVKSVETDLSVTMQLPQWHRPEGVSPTRAREWDRYMAALRAHEDGHADIGVAVADAIKRELPAMRSASGCPDLAKKLDRTAMAIVDEHKARELEYDASTRHGATQGARLQVDAPR